jgi:hypothetical protein
MPKIDRPPACDDQEPTLIGVRDELLRAMAAVRERVIALEYTINAFITEERQRPEFHQAPLADRDIPF